MERDKNKKKRGLQEYLKVGLLLLFSLVLLETLCFLALEVFFPSYETYPYNRIASGNTIYYNTPGYNYGKGTIKTLATEKDLVIDSNGFVCNHPVLLNKPAGVTRIFLMGGSAMFGSGQSRPYDQIAKFPSGTYSWESSIAGYLQRTLDSLCPDKKFEVINASCSGFTTLQSMSLYLDKVCRFSPDYIIEMDGMNDLGTMICGKYMDLSESVFDSYLDLATRNSHLVNLNTIKLVQMIQERLEEKKSERLSAKNSTDKLSYDPKKFTLANFLQIKNTLNENSIAYVQALDRYQAVLKTDSVRFIFVLQPLLNRSITNKQLSDTEVLFATKVDPITSPESEINRIVPPNFKGLSLTSYDIMHLMLFYYFDHGFADQIRQSVEKQQYQFIDGNASIAGLDKDVAFFTDYCHLTPGANQYMARLFAKKIITQMSPPEQQTE